MQESIILGLNSRMTQHSILMALVPLLSDIFVFLYPVYLIYLYFKPLQKPTRRKNILGTSPSEKIYKYTALSIFFSVIVSIIINYIIKAFISEPRPFNVLQLTSNPKQALILTGLPTDTFPSDHASVSFAFALTLLIFGYRQKNRSFIVVGRCFFVFAVVMGISRITIGVHWPADIIGGLGVALISTSLITYPPLSNYLYVYIYNPLIKVQEYIWIKIKQLTNQKS